MAFSESLRPNEPVNETAFMQRIYDLRYEHSPMVVVRQILHKSREQVTEEQYQAVEEKARSARIIEEEVIYLTMLAKNTLGKPVNAKALQSQEKLLRAHYTQFEEFLAKAVREYSHYLEAEEKRANINIPNGDRHLFAGLLHVHAAPVDDLLMIGPKNYIKMLQNCVKTAANEFGIASRKTR